MEVWSQLDLTVLTNPYCRILYGARCRSLLLLVNPLLSLLTELICLDNYAELQHLISESRIAGLLMFTGIGFGLWFCVLFDKIRNYLRDGYLPGFNSPIFINYGQIITGRMSPGLINLNYHFMVFLRTKTPVHVA